MQKTDVSLCGGERELEVTRTWNGLRIHRVPLRFEPDPATRGNHFEEEPIFGLPAPQMYQNTGVVRSVPQRPEICKSAGDRLDGA